MTSKTIQPGRLYCEYPGATPPDSVNSLSVSLEGYTPAKMAAVAAAPQAHSTFLGLTENSMSLKREKPFVGSGA